MTTSIQRGLLTDEMLARFDERAPVYDKENRFFDEDFKELKQSGSPCRRPVPVRRIGRASRLSKGRAE